MEVPLKSAFTIKHAVVVSIGLHGVFFLMPGRTLDPAPPEPQQKGDMYVEIPLEQTWDWQDEAIADIALNDLPETEMFRPPQETRTEVNFPSPIDHAVFPVPELDFPELDTQQEVSSSEVLEDILKDEPEPVEVQAASAPPIPQPPPPEIVGLEDGSILDQENPLEVPYPQMARRRGQEGAVIVHIAINPEGVVQEVTVKESSGYALLDNAVLRAVKRHQYEPLVQNGRALAAEFDYKVQFVLK